MKLRLKFLHFDSFLVIVFYLQYFNFWENLTSCFSSIFFYSELCFYFCYLTNIKACWLYSSNLKPVLHVQFVAFVQLKYFFQWQRALSFLLNSTCADCRLQTADCADYYIYAFTLLLVKKTRR